MYMNFYFNFMLCIFSILIFTLFYKHILLTLISLEFIMINLMMIIYYILLNFNMNMIFIFIFFTISVCESVIGLSLLILLIRYMGNDYMKIMNLMKW
uniref:NADH-ubiquinone oxidoreductase chain 4L n=1 Tax=Therophilus festivus TaxID=1421599 RepID=A0A0A6ZLP2_9HYME|nr:NADH dehydrogenase subunit 4L [Therophilus festivus]